MGSIYLRGDTYWCKYYCDGRPVRESTGSTKLKEAKTFLQSRVGHMTETGKAILPSINRMGVTELLDDLRKDYEISGTRALREVDQRLKPLYKFFQGYRASAIKGPLLTKYAHARQLQGTSNATINRERSILIRAFKVGLRNEKVLSCPAIPQLKESDPRQGFFERDNFERVRKCLDKRPDIQCAITLANEFGWRMQSEILALSLSQLDLEIGTVRLEAAMTKTRRARTIYLTPATHALVREQVERVKALAKQLGRVIPYLFPNPLKGRHQGKQLQDIKTAWKTATRKAGLAGALLHDFRRTACRNMIRANIPQVVAMRISGHQTPSVFSRYNITSDADLKDAALKIHPHGHNLGTISTSTPLRPSLSRGAGERN